MTVVGTVAACRRYPVKSLQGVEADHIEIGATGVVGDRQWGFLDHATGKLMSAKRFSALLGATGSDAMVVLANGDEIPLDQSDAAAAVSLWLGREVTIVRPDHAADMVYEMTFDPPNDDAELFDIPTPEGTFLDLAAVHIISSNTLRWCQDANPDLDWDVRRFRPNLVVDLDGVMGGFAEDRWVGQRLRLGGAVLEVSMPAVRCAMPLRAQPGGLARQPAMFRALSDLNADNPNHLGIYLDVVEPGAVCVGDPIEVLDD
jgi:MOSC domain-containing protein